jgi:hypothetical protein
VERLKAALQADYVVLGGGNAGLVKGFQTRLVWGTTLTRSSVELDSGRTDPALQAVHATNDRPKEVSRPSCSSDL